MIVCLWSFCCGRDFCVTRLGNTAENISNRACAHYCRPVASSLVAEFETLIFAFMGLIPTRQSRYQREQHVNDHYNDATMIPLQRFNNNLSRLSATEVRRYALILVKK